MAKNSAELLASFDAFTVLLPIDMQQAFDHAPWGKRNNPDVDQNGQALLKLWRAKGWPILHVRHDSVVAGSTLAPGSSGNAFRAGFEPLAGEPVVSKSVNSAFIGTDLDLRLKCLNAKRVVTFGITTDMCVSTTVRTGANMGWEMVLVEDACSCCALPDINGEMIEQELLHRIHVATLGVEFARVVQTKAVLAAIT